MFKNYVMKGIALSVMLLSCGYSFSQCTSPVPATADKIALPTTTAAGCPNASFITSASNTGTDVYNDGTNTCQVMVWDGTSASFSWDYGGATGSLLFTALAPLAGSTLVDPDVVVNRASGGTYAMVVGQVATGANANRIFWASFRWGGAAFTLNSSGFLGVTTNGPCRNPNIDVNYCGRVAIVWSQGIASNYTITVSGGPFTFPSTVVSIFRSDIFWAQGFVDGTSCTAAGVVSGVVTATGDKVSYPTSTPHLFESNINPDVAFSDPASGSCGGNSYAIDVTYLNQWFVASTFNITSQVVVRQFKELTCISPAALSGEYIFNCNGVAGRPRIAARPTTGSNYDDFQVVMANPASVCNAGGPPCQFFSTAIYNWGKHNGTVAPLSPLAPNVLTATPISPCNLSSVYNDHAVVTYRDLTTSTTGDFVVAWTNGSGLITNVVANDVIAKTYNQGIANLAASTQFSIVNRGCAGLTSNQSIPSIAGRYWKEVGYDFYDNASSAAKPYIGYKLSGVNPGTGVALRTAGHTNPVTGKTDETFGVQPNPFDNEITFDIGLGSENAATQIEIRDVSGRLVETLKVDGNADQVSWKPTADVKSGMYYAKLFTAKGTMVTQIVKN